MCHQTGNRDQQQWVHRRVNTSPAFQKGTRSPPSNDESMIVRSLPVLSRYLGGCSQILPLSILIQRSGEARAGAVGAPTHPPHSSVRIMQFMYNKCMVLYRAWYYTGVGTCSRGCSARSSRLRAFSLLSRRRPRQYAPHKTCEGCCRIGCCNGWL